jgi:hypothetical protein
MAKIKNIPSISISEAKQRFLWTDMELLKSLGLAVVQSPSFGSVLSRSEY